MPVDVSDPAIAAAYQDVRSESNPTNWVVLGYESFKKLFVQAEQTGDINDLANTLEDDQVQYGYMRFTLSDAETSDRTKFIFITWVGPRTSTLKKARVAADKADVKKVFRDFALEYPCESKDQLDQSKIENAHKSGG